MKKIVLNKKQKTWIIVGSVLLAIVIVMSSLMGAAVAKSKADQTVASGTLSMLGNFLRNKNKIQYETFGSEALYPVENFRVTMSAMNHWENGARFLKELITWGKNNGMAGIRPWAPELDWVNPWFNFNESAKTATAKMALFNALKAAV